MQTDSRPDALYNWAAGVHHGQMVAKQPTSTLASTAGKRQVVTHRVDQGVAAIRDVVEVTFRHVGRLVGIVITTGSRVDREVRGLAWDVRDVAAAAFHTDDVDVTLAHGASSVRLRCGGSPARTSP